MGAGGEAPPVKSEDVMILIGASILLLMFILQTWTVPTNITAGEENEFTIKYDLSEGDTFSFDVVNGEVRPTVVLPDEERVFGDLVGEGNDWEYVAENSGVHIFTIVAFEDSEITYDMSRGILIDFALYPIGGLILGYGILKKVASADEEPLEAVLED
ncbi:MAG: hypothetical protein DWC06_05340 [Candidatus Poseidoniales archaeon]|nr:MAG: hypothetical protein DWC06_05340 [Candidatus Poseidoniales archaeon]